MRRAARTPSLSPETRIWIVPSTRQSQANLGKHGEGGSSRLILCHERVVTWHGTITSEKDNGYNQKQRVVVFLCNYLLAWMVTARALALSPLTSWAAAPWRAAASRPACGSCGRARSTGCPRARPPCASCAARQGLRVSDVLSTSSSFDCVCT